MGGLWVGAALREVEGVADLVDVAAVAKEDSFVGTTAAGDVVAVETVVVAVTTTEVVVSTVDEDSLDGSAGALELVELARAEVDESSGTADDEAAAEDEVTPLELALLLLDWLDGAAGVSVVVVAAAGRPLYAELLQLFGMQAAACTASSTPVKVALSK